jgi:hypothetical protein
VVGERDGGAGFEADESLSGFRLIDKWRLVISDV